MRSGGNLATLSERYDKLTNPEPAELEQRRVSDIAVSAIRTLVPAALGTALAWVAAHWGIVVPQDLAGEAAVILAGLCIAGWWGLARWLETRRGGGWFAVVARPVGRYMPGGTVRQPVYTLATERIAVIGRNGIPKERR